MLVRVRVSGYLMIGLNASEGWDFRLFNDRVKC